MRRKASAVREGGSNGRGKLSTASGVGTNPEELIAAPAVDLDVSALIPGADAAAFATAANNAKARCPVSRVLNAKISMNGRLEA